MLPAWAEGPSNTRLVSPALLKQAGIALPLWPIARLVEVQEPERAGRQAGGGGGFGVERDEEKPSRGRITGRTRTCWFETLQYDGFGVPYGPYCH